MLLGCSDDQNEQISIVEGIEIRIIKDFEEIELESLYRTTYAFDSRSITLSNILTEEIRVSFEFEVHQYLGYSLQMLDNYYILELFIGDEAQIASGVISDMPFAIEFYILDESLNVVETFNVTEEDGMIFSWLLQSHGRQLSLKNDEWLVYIMHHNWSLGYTVLEFYTYNLHTRELTLMAEIEDSNFTGGSLQLISATNQLAFMLTHFIGEMVSHVELGLMDLDTFETNIIYSTDDFNSAMMDVFGEYLVVFESWADEETLESEVVLIHSLTGEVRNVLLIDYRTVWPSLTADGQFVFIGRTDWESPDRSTRVRLYDTQTGVVVFEHMLIDRLNENEGFMWLEFHNIDENIYSISVDIWEYDDRGWLAERSRIEYIVIEFLVTDDE